MQLPTLSVLLPAHQEAEHIGAVIHALQTSTYPIEQIVVVADACTDDTAGIARSMGCTVIETNHQDKAEAQNSGFALIDTELVAGMDGDTVPDVDCIRLMVKDLVEKGYDATCSTILPIQAKGLFIRSRRFAYSLGRMSWRWAQAQVGKIQVLTGASYLFRSDVVRAVGGFPGGLVSNDMDLTWALHTAGYKCGYTGSALAYTYDPETFTVYRSQMRRWASGYFQNMAKYKGTWLRSPAGFLVVGGALLDLCLLFWTEAWFVWALATGNYHSSLRWILTFLAVRTVVTVGLVARTVGLKEALLGVGPYTVVNVYNKWIYLAAGFREWILGKHYMSWTGRQQRATVISPMTSRRKLTLAALAAVALIASALPFWTAIAQSA